MTEYWILQIVAGQVILRGPFSSDAERESELQMCAIDPGNEYLILIDPTSQPDGRPVAWKISKEYERELRDAVNNLPD